MPTPADNINTAIANYSAILADISANPKTNYTAAGRSFSWIEYQKFLIDSIAALQDAKQATSTPFIVRGIGRA